MDLAKKTKVHCLPPIFLTIGDPGKLEADQKREWQELAQGCVEEGFSPGAIVVKVTTKDKWKFDNWGVVIRTFVEYPMMGNDEFAPIAVTWFNGRSHDRLDPCTLVIVQPGPDEEILMEMEVCDV